MDSLEKTMNEVFKLEREAEELMLRLNKESDLEQKQILKLLHGQNEMKRMMIGITLALQSVSKK